MSAMRGAALALLFVRPSLAAPGFWDIARDPTVQQRDTDTVVVERMLMNSEQSYGVASMESNFAETASALAEIASRSNAPDSRLQYLWGRALVTRWIRDPRTARRLLGAVLIQPPSPDIEGDAWFRTGIAAACSGDRGAAILAYTNALERAWEPGLRSEIRLELAETLLANGALARAGVEFGVAAHSALKRRIEAQAHFGLASALERSGHRRGALAAARDARSVLLPRAYYGSTDVLAFPALGCELADAERQFRAALGATAVALAERELDLRVGMLEDAIAAWNAYIELASGDQVGRSRAEVRRTQCFGELRAPKALEGAKSDTP